MANPDKYESKEWLKKLATQSALYSVDRIGLPASKR